MATLTLGKSVTIDAVQSKKGERAYAVSQMADVRRSRTQDVRFAAEREDREGT